MKKLFIVIILFILVILGGLAWWFNGKSPVDTNNKTQQTFMIKPQENIRDVGYSLKKNGLIKSPVIFFLMVKQMGLDDKIQAGNFQLSSSMSTAQVILTLTHGTTDIWVTIPEGLRATEVAELLATKLPNYDASWKNKLVAEEGYLFPDTYSFSTKTTVDDVINIMKDNFNKKYAIATAQQTNKLTQQDAVILASIVQREAISPQDMRGVASVLENRLNIGMALGSDVTVAYALGYIPSEHTWWKKDLTVDDLAIKSPYNTRNTAGLPPTPIANPGLTALEAVLNPVKSNYLYFISDSKGKIHFAETIDQHNANISKYMQ
jgi:UPF0755 protein